MIGIAFCDQEHLFRNLPLYPPELRDRPGRDIQKTDGVAKVVQANAASASATQSLLPRGGLSFHRAAGSGLTGQYGTTGGLHFALGGGQYYSIYLYDTALADVTSHLFFI